MPPSRAPLMMVHGLRCACHIDAKITLAGLKLEIRYAGGIGNVQDLLPGLSAIAAAVYAALFVCDERIPERRHKDNIGIGRMDPNRGDLPNVAQPDKLPRLARICRFVDAAPNGNIAANFR